MSSGSYNYNAAVQERAGRDNPRMKVTHFFFRLIVNVRPVNGLVSDRVENLELRVSVVAAPRGGCRRSRAQRLDALGNFILSRHSHRHRARIVDFILETMKSTGIKGFSRPMKRSRRASGRLRPNGTRTGRQRKCLRLLLLVVLLLLLLLLQLMQRAVILLKIGARLRLRPLLRRTSSTADIQRP